jgi:hypothetical protein
LTGRSRKISALSIVALILARGGPTTPKSIDPNLLRSDDTEASWER